MAQLIGLMRLGQDAELRYTPNGDPVLNLSLAYNYGQKKDGHQPTQWVRATVWGKRAEAVAPYMLKGTAIVAYIGDLHIREWEKDGKSGSSLEGRMEHFEFAGGGKDKEGQQPQRSTASDYARASGRGTTSRQPAQQPAADNAPFEDDDIPF